MKTKHFIKENFMVLHPEKLLGLRGNFIAKKSYETISGALSVCSYNLLSEDDPSNNKARLAFTQYLSKHPMYDDAETEKEFWGATADRIFGDQVGPIGAIWAVEAIGKFLKTRKVYRFGSDFFKVLKNVEVAVNYEMLKDFKEKTGYVILPSEGVDGDNAFYFDIHEPLPTEGDRSMMVVTFIPIFEEGSDEFNRQKNILGSGLDFPLTVSSISSSSSIFYHEREDKKKPSEMGFTKVKEDGDTLKENVQRVMNCIIYINSQEPDLQKTVPDFNLTVKRKRELAEKGMGLNEFALPIINVSWNYKKPTIYNMDSSFVETHPRWQPCGPNRSQVKLIWVKEHERHYKNVREEEQQAPPL